MSSDFLNALAELEREKGINKSILIDAIENALVSAYKKNYGTAQDVRVEVDPDSGMFKVFAKKTVVETVEDDTAAVLFRPDEGPPCVVLDIDEDGLRSTRSTNNC